MERRKKKLSEEYTIEKEIPKTYRKQKQKQRVILLGGWCLHKNFQSLVYSTGLCCEGMDKTLWTPSKKINFIDSFH